MSLTVGDGWVPYPDFFYREVEGHKIEFQPPPGTRIVRIVSNDGVALEHLTGVINDLKATINYCTLYDESFTDSMDSGIQEALWKAALITYARVFENGVRKSERPDLRVFEEFENARAAHDYFIALRSKYVAHSVNALETNMTYALLTTIRGEVMVAKGPGTFQISSNPLDEVGTKTLKRLAQTLLEQALERHHHLTEKVMSELHSMPQAQLAALPAITEHQAPGVARINVTRK